MNATTEPVFTTDWSSTRSYWQEMFDRVAMPGRPGLRFLEIGCFEGMATVWLLDHVLTDPSSEIHVVDTFQGSPEFEIDRINGDSYRLFAANTERYRGRVHIHVGESHAVLRTLTGPFDFVYVDASHMAKDVLADAVLAWPLLRVGGLMVFDDYLWGHTDGDSTPAWVTPKPAIEAFLACYEPELQVGHVEWQVAVQKLPPAVVRMVK